MKPNLLHLPLEPYKARYTEYLDGIEKNAFEGAGFDYKRVAPAGDSVPLQITAGRVLDSYQRPLWCFDQIKQLLTTPLDNVEAIYLSDFYTPGLDALPYATVGKMPPIYTFLWAQTFDRYDFTTQMIHWMRHWEKMAMNIYTRVFVASELLADLITTALPSMEGKIIPIGLPFDSETVKPMLQIDDPFLEEHPYDVVYSSRWDQEKNPMVFAQLVERRPDLSFLICTGHEVLRGTDRAAIDYVTKLASMKGTNLTIKSGLTKSNYYALLSRSKVQFNCALQDWVSYTLLEALTFGCTPLYPNTRSFTDALGHYSEYLYRPMDVEDASNHLDYLLTEAGKMPGEVRRSLLQPHNLTLPTIAKIIKSEL